jgi:putative IMPACT (imprinted ancient) family translation regulator
MCSDAGEPAHSAGAPILRVILSAQLTHATIVVARYFGGVKLGLPALIRAYAAAAQNALDANEVVSYVPARRVALVFEYPQTVAVKKITNGFRVVESVYDERCRIVVEVPEFDWARVREMLRNRGIEYQTAGQ